MVVLLQDAIAKLKAVKRETANKGNEGSWKLWRGPFAHVEDSRTRRVNEIDKTIKQLEQYSALLEGRKVTLEKSGYFNSFLFEKLELTKEPSKKNVEVVAGAIIGEFSKLKTNLSTKCAYTEGSIINTIDIIERDITAQKEVTANETSEASVVRRPTLTGGGLKI